ncbi:MAG TPA: hypothetical protein VKM55_29275 [Candidatus Lokiarchaeia archaeon]|nr:hypothetical protein [Candidatus Lokiarchaeia archaeon]
MNVKNGLSAFFQGTITKKTMLTRLIPLILAILGVTIFIANFVFPTAYDWRYMVLSALSEPGDNPAGYLFPTIGMTIAGLLMIPFPGYYQKKLGKICRGSTGVGSFFMIVAIVGMIGLSTISLVVTGIKNFHEILAGLAFIGIIFAGSFYGCPIIKDNAKGAKQFNMRLFRISMIVMWSPVVGMAASALYIAIVNPPWSWTGFSWIAMGVPPWMSFAFWEWLLFVAVLAFVVMLAIMVPENVTPFERQK